MLALLLAAALAVAGLATLTSRRDRAEAAATAGVVAVVSTPSGNGYWLVAADGGVFAFGDATFLGSTGGMHLAAPIVAAAAAPSGNGYWLVAADGGVFTFGGAGYLGSTGGIRLNQPIVAMAVTPIGRGYWLIARDGGVFAFGDAAFYGSTGAIRLNQPVVGADATTSGHGYWLVAADGGVFAFGDAAFHGSTGSIRLARPVVGMASTPTGAGYWMAGADGGLFSFGDAGFHGSAAPPPPTGPSIDGCPVLPADNPWNTDVSVLPVHPNSNAYISAIQAFGSDNLHPDFGGGGEYGIPYIIVSGSQPRVPINFTAYGDESDPGPYPIPLNAPIEGGAGSGGDRHVLAVDRDACMLYEMYRAFPGAGAWEAEAGAVWNLQSNALRPAGWTSADAAGLPILPGLVRYDEVAAGAVQHAIRVTFSRTQRGYVLPATHAASSYTNPNYPPMGLRLRLRADFDVSGYQGEARVILEGLKRYGMIVADNGSNWYLTGAADPRWDDNDLHQLSSVPGTAFEVVDTGPIH